MVERLWWQTDQYFEGRQAYADDVPISMCPYRRNTTEQDDWVTGWCDAEAVDPERQAELVALLEDVNPAKPYF
jgi:ribosome modulation factor